MADTKPAHDVPPVEGDGLHYPGLGWFVVVLVGVTLFCQVLVWGMFEFSEWRLERSDPPRAPLAGPAATPEVRGGQLISGTGAQGPQLLVNEPDVLREFRQQERTNLDTYGWVDQAAQQVRLPIDRAKDLLLERGLPVRAGAGPARDAARPGFVDTGTGARSTTTGTPQTGDRPQGTGITAPQGTAPAPETKGTAAPAAGAGHGGGH